MTDLEIFLRLSTIELQHLVLTERREEISEFFGLLDSYLALFDDEESESSQVMLKKVTSEILERLENQVTELVAVLSAIKTVEVESEFVILAACKFLTNWMSCELRAQTAHMIAENLTELADFAKEKNEDIYIAFLWGFYKATDLEKAAEKFYFETGLINMCKENLEKQTSPAIQDRLYNNEYKFIYNCLPYLKEIFILIPL